MPKQNTRLYLNTPLVQELLREKGLSAKAASEALGWSHSSLTRYMNWESLIAYKRVVQLVALLGATFPCRLYRKPTQAMITKRNNFLSSTRSHSETNGEQVKMTDTFEDNNKNYYLNTNFLKKLLKGSQTEQDQLAIALGWSTYILQKYMTWKCLISAKRVKQLADYWHLYPSMFYKFPTKKMREKHEEYLAELSNYHQKAKTQLNADDEIEGEPANSKSDSDALIISLIKQVNALSDQNNKIIGQNATIKNQNEDLKKDIQSIQNMLVKQTNELKEFLGTEHSGTMSELKDIKSHITKPNSSNNSLNKWGDHHVAGKI